LFVYKSSGAFKAPKNNTEVGWYQKSISLIRSSCSLADRESWSKEYIGD